MRIYYKPFRTNPLLVHLAGRTGTRQIKAFRRLARRSFKKAAEAPCQDLTVLTWNNGDVPDEDSGEKNAFLGTFEESCSWFGQQVVVLGRDCRNWKNRLKIPLTVEALEDVRTPYVMAADSSDCILLSPPGEILRKYRAHFAADLIFCAGDNYPGSTELRAFESSLPMARVAKLVGVNSGAWIGKTEFCREFFDRASRARDCRSDQSAARFAHRHFYPKAGIDYLHLLFHRWSGFDEVDLVDVQ